MMMMMVIHVMIMIMMMLMIMTKTSYKQTHISCCHLATNVPLLMMIMTIMTDDDA